MKSNDTPALHGWRPAASEPEIESYIPIGCEQYDAQIVLFLQTNRISAYGQVFPTLIPGKAIITNQLSLWWYERLAKLNIPNHFVSGNQVPEHAAGRALLVARLDMYPVQSRVFGYMTTEAMAEYQQTGGFLGDTKLPAGLSFGDRLEKPICSIVPRTKFGKHNQNINKEQLKAMLGGGPGRLQKIVDDSLAMYELAAQTAQKSDLVLAQSNFMFGDGLSTGRPMVVAGGQMLTSGSTIFWRTDPQDGSRALPSAASFERQALYDWVASDQCDWDPQSGDPAPEIPAEVVAKLAEDFQVLYEVLTDRTINF